MSKELFKFVHTKKALADVEGILCCKKCGLMMDVPVKYQMCGHLLCKSCSHGQGNTCPSCLVPSRVSEIKADNFTHNLIKAWKMIAEVIGYDSGKHAEEMGNVPQLASEQIYSHQSNHAEVENKQLRRRAAKKREMPKDSPIIVSAVRGKPSSDSKQPRSKAGRGQGRPRKAMLCDRKSGGSGCSASEDGSTPQSTPWAGNKSLESGRGSTPKNFFKARSASTPLPKKDLTMKRNAKGETLLHVACIKGNLDQVKALLDSGASPNTKDNAGWTPLHEVSSMGSVELVALLLGAGALPSVPGPENMTPLHDAVLNKNVEVVRLLVAHGADVNARSSTGATPVQSTTDDQILALLKEPPTVVVPHHAQLLDGAPPIPGEVSLLPCGLDAVQQAQLQEFALGLNAKLCVSHTASFTHVVVPSNEENVCPVTVVTLTAILLGKWIVNFEWIVKSMEAGKVLPFSQFEVKGTIEYPTSGASRNSRINLQLQCPRLFNGCHMYLVPQQGSYVVGDVQLSKAELAALVTAGDGVLLGREPDPEAIPPSQCMVPYHAAPDSPLAKCSHYLIYQPGGRGEPLLKYNMAHIKSLPVGWLLACVQTFSLVYPDH